MTERRSIESRLENWGRWAVAGDERTRAAACMTGAICEAMRKAHEGVLPATAGEYGQRAINSDDAVLVQRAVIRIAFTHRQLLGLHYVDGERKGWIAARLRFPLADYDRMMDAARADIAAVLALPCLNSNSK